MNMETSRLPTFLLVAVAPVEGFFKVQVQVVEPWPSMRKGTSSLETECLLVPRVEMVVLMEFTIMQEEDPEVQAEWRSALARATR